MVLLASLACIELYDADQKQIQQSMMVPPESVVVQVPGNGLCFWSCLYLSIHASPYELFHWHSQPRNSTGFPSPTRSKEEQEKVLTWALGLRHVFAQSCPMPLETKQRVRTKESATHMDMEPGLMIVQNVLLTKTFTLSFCSHEDAIATNHIQYICIYNAYLQYIY